MKTAGQQASILTLPKLHLATLNIVSDLIADVLTRLSSTRNVAVKSRLKSKESLNLTMLMMLAVKTQVSVH